MLVGTRYFEREFGVETERRLAAGLVSASPGRCPTLMAAAGVPYFVTHKLSWSQTNRIPHDTFRWRGPDGSEVLAHFLCTPSLCAGRAHHLQRHAAAQRRPRRLASLPGPPAAERAAGGVRLWRRWWRPDHRDDRSRSAAQGPARAFRACRWAAPTSSSSGWSATWPQQTDVPVWDGELYLEYHRGTYTGQARQKLRNALSQRLYPRRRAVRRELRARCWVRAYPRQALEEGWRLILTNQFHDILPGSAISSVYVEAEAGLLSSGGHRPDRCSRLALRQLAAAINLESRRPGRLQSRAVSVGWLPGAAGWHRSRQACRCRHSQRPTAAAGVVRGRARQWLPGFSQRLDHSAPGAPARALARHASGEVESPFWRIELDERGRISSPLGQAPRARRRAAGQAWQSTGGLRRQAASITTPGTSTPTSTAKSTRGRQAGEREVRESGPERASSSCAGVSASAPTSSSGCASTRARRASTFVTRWIGRSASHC